MSALSLASARFSKNARCEFHDLLDGDVCKISLVSIFSLFSIFQSLFYSLYDFTHIAASDTASHDVTK